MIQINEQEVFEKLLDFGLFPEKISKIFTSESFGKWARKKDISNYKKENFSSITFRLTRNNNAPRILNIPHPIPYFHLCKEIKSSWNKISNKIGEVDDYTKRSMIIPKPNNLSQRLVSMLSYDRNKDEKFLSLEKSFKAKYYVHADIANCYPSIYSHCVPWALVGKVESKNNKNNHEEWYNKLDTKIRYMQRNETVGLPIGPDTSSIISELILSCVDKELEKYNYFRYIDDYKCYCSSKDEAENFLKNLSKELEKFNLRLNQKKTEIIELPKIIEEEWVRELKFFANIFLADDELSKKNINHISHFIDIAIKLTKKYPNDSALKYAVKIISKKKFIDNDVLIFTIMNISRICFIYPYFIDVFYDILEINDRDSSISKLITREINVIICEHLEYSRSDVSLWGIYLAITFNFKIENFDNYSKYLLEERDCLPSLLCYIYSKKYNLNTEEYFNLIAQIVSEEQEDEWWIFIYTLYFDNPKHDVFKEIKYKDFYYEMRKGKICFINLKTHYIQM